MCSHVRRNLGMVDLCQLPPSVDFAGEVAFQCWFRQQFSTAEARRGSSPLSHFLGWAVAGVFVWREARGTGLCNFCFCSILELRLKSWEKQPCTLAHNGGPQTERQFAFIFRTPSCACCFGGLEIVTKFSRPPFLSTKLASSSLKMASACSQNPPVAMCTAWYGTGSIQGTALGQYRARIQGKVACVHLAEGEGGGSGSVDGGPGGVGALKGAGALKGGPEARAGANTVCSVPCGHGVGRARERGL